MRGLNIDYDKLAEMHRQGYTHKQMAAAIGCKLSSVNKYIRVLTKSGVITARNGYFQREYKEQRIEQIRNYALEGMTRDAICEKMGISYAAMFKYEKELRDRYNVYLVKKGKPRKYISTIQTAAAEPTLAPGQTIRCTQTVANNCVYGGAKSGSGLCNYALITKKCRSLGEDGCDYLACTKFSKVSATNPKLEVKM